MLFNSHVFLFVFFPITLIGFFWFARHAGMVPAQMWLTFASFVFYGWSGWRFLPLLIGSTLVNFAVGCALIARARTARRRGGLLAAGVAFDLLVLGYFKYAGFFETNLHVLGIDLGLGSITLPIGISFYTFTQIAFLADAAQGKAAEYDLSRYALFVSFFPHLIAGPIIHHKEMMPQFAEQRVYRFDPENLATGLTLFTLGLFKKVVLADRIAPYASPVFAAADAGGTIPMADAWIAALAYTLQIYFDFSAYSDMAIGLARMFGIHLPLNFNSPYKATSIIDFWRRWHMTLSRFLRDYLYIPLGGNRKGELRRYLNLMITMLLGGLWHGAGWTFVFWGVVHGLFLAFNHLWRTAGLALPRWPAWAVTFLLVVFTWVFFRADTFAGALAVIQGMLGLSGFFAPHFVKTDGLWLIVVLLAISAFAPNTQEILRAHMPAAFYRIAPPAGALARLQWEPCASLAVASAVLFVVALLFMPRASEFLYFQF